MFEWLRNIFRREETLAECHARKLKEAIAQADALAAVLKEVERRHGIGKPVQRFAAPHRRSSNTTTTRRCEDDSYLYAPNIIDSASSSSYSSSSPSCSSYDSGSSSGSGSCGGSD